MSFEYNNSSGMPVGYVQDITNLNLNGRYVSICVDNGATAFPLTLSEVKVYGCVSSSNPCLNNQNPSISISSSSSSYPRNSSFTISSSVNDPDGTISKVEFYNGTNLLNTDLSTPFEYSINPASDISYSISAKVYDDWVQ
ncbi:MAG: hypothetical protein IPI77_19265 [Saprospiraceae bacterium]|nr:hypothetical protein [Saprospiraceae bacterium]